MAPATEAAMDELIEILSRWTKKYLFAIEQTLEAGNAKLFKYRASFSVPTLRNPIPQAEAHILFDFEDGGETIRYHFENEDSTYRTLRNTVPLHFEERIDRLIVEKLEERIKIDLATPFEKSRHEQSSTTDAIPTKFAGFVPQYYYVVKRDKSSRSTVGHESASISAEDRTEGVLDEQDSFVDFLSKMFDAADEEKTGALEIFQIEELLRASELGLSNWDLLMVLLTMRQKSGGYVEYAEWVEESYTRVNEIRNWRKSFDTRECVRQHVSEESILQCFGKEIEETERLLGELFLSFDKENSGKISYNNVAPCLKSLNFRISAQEARALLLRLHPGEDSAFEYASLKAELVCFRQDSYANAIFESSSSLLRGVLEASLLKEGIKEEGTIWVLREVLLKLPNVFLSRMQVHAILCAIQTDADGIVKVADFIHTICKLVPVMFDPEKITQTGKDIEEEREELKRKEDMADLNMKPHVTTQVNFPGATSKNKRQRENLEVIQMRNVEKTLIHLFKLMDDEHSGSLPVHRFMLAMKVSDANEKRHNDAIQSCQLTEPEIRGFVAEAVLNESNKFRYIEHVKTWVPILFEMRKMKVFSSVIGYSW